MTMTRRILLVLLFVLAAAGLLWWRQQSRQPAPAAAAALQPLAASEDLRGYARATEPDAIRFPQDLGPHDDYQTEWWYYTGNLAADDGRAFGYQLTFFRRALTPPPPAGESRPGANPWRTNQVYLAHFTVSDVANQAFYPAERFSRGAAGLAGAQAEPYHVWLEDWSATEVAPGVVRLQAQTADAAIDLTLTQTRPPVLHGQGGLSPKGPEPGNASYYYSLVQQTTSGTVRVGQEQLAVRGLSWKDHEYSTSALSAGAIGWDWFSLQLDDGGALMLFQIRNEAGGLEPFSAGTYVAPDGRLTPLALGDWQLVVTDTWQSPESGAVYPAGWQLTIPALGLSLSGRPQMPNQELNVSTVYWEGAVTFSGTIGDRPVTAQGYVEMTGYAHSMKGQI